MKKRFKKMFMITLIIFITLIVAFCAYYYFFVYRCTFINSVSYEYVLDHNIAVIGISLEAYKYVEGKYPLKMDNSFEELSAYLNKKGWRTNIDLELFKNGRIDNYSSNGRQYKIEGTMDRKAEKVVILPQKYLYFENGIWKEHQIGRLNPKEFESLNVNDKAK